MTDCEVLRLECVEVQRATFRLGPVDLAVRQGESVCVVGPNGSGKTTLLSIAAGLLKPLAGRVVVVGREPDLMTRNHLADIGFVADDPKLLIEEVSAPEYWSLLARLRAEARPGTASLADDIAAMLGFSPPDRRIATYSHGMRKKTQLVAALAHRPQIIIVDELRNGLDPIAARRAEHALAEARRDGAGLLFASHDLYWAERNADRIVVLCEGRVIASGSPAEVKLPNEPSLEDAFLRLVGMSP